MGGTTSVVARLPLGAWEPMRSGKPRLVVRALYYSGSPCEFDVELSWQWPELAAGTVVTSRALERCTCEAQASPTTCFLQPPAGPPTQTPAIKGSDGAHASPSSLSLVLTLHNADGWRERSFYWEVAAAGLDGTRLLWE